jgi:hypothetical protein
MTCPITRRRGGPTQNVPDSGYRKVRAPKRPNEAAGKEPLGLVQSIENPETTMAMELLRWWPVEQLAGEPPTAGPPELPQPGRPDAAQSDTYALVNEVFLMAVGFVLHHELAHLRLKHHSGGDSHFALAPVVEPSGSRRLVSGHLLGNVELAALLEVVGDARRTERVIADARVEPGRLRAADGLPPRVGSAKRLRGQLG